MSKKDFKPVVERPKNIDDPVENKNQKTKPSPASNLLDTLNAVHGKKEAKFVPPPEKKIKTNVFKKILYYLVSKPTLFFSIITFFILLLLFLLLV